MRESSKAALCGVITALSVVIMLSTYLSPFLVYTAPVFAGLLLIIIVSELGFKWGISTYFSVSLLSLFIISDKESAIFFVLFFGYYPMVAYYIDKKIKNVFLRLFLKLFIFNTSCFLSLLSCFFILGINSEEFFTESIAYQVIFIFLMNVLFFVYELLTRRLQELYEKKFRMYLRKLFNLK